MNIEPTLSGWASIKSKLIAVIRVANQVTNARIQRGGATDSISFSGDSIVINLKSFPGAASGGGVASEITFPLQLVQVDGTTVAVRKGTVNNIVPKIGGTDLNDDYILNTISVGAETTFWLNATLDANSIITSVSIDTTDPGVDTSTQAKQTLGSLTWDSGAIDALSSNLTGSQNVDSCAAIHSWNAV